jgi:hypothetical protein
LATNVVGTWQLKLTNGAIIDLDISQLGWIIFGKGNVSSGGYQQSVTTSGSIKGKWLGMDIVPASGTEMYTINLDLSNQPIISGNQIVNESAQLFKDTKVLDR